MLPAVDINDPTQRFLLLTPEQQAWYGSEPFPCTPDNLDMAYSIAKIFPVRLKWFRKDRFGKEYLSCKKFQAEYFVIQNRVKELGQHPKPKSTPIDLDLYRRLWDYKVKKIQNMPVDPYLQTR